jgi:hypothetical protein
MLSLHLTTHRLHTLYTIVCACWFLSCQTFLRDILDGYFPAELQERFPDGVPFKPHDHRTQAYAAVSFPGTGHQVGGAIKPSSLVPTAATSGGRNVATLSGLSDGAQPPARSAASLLARLPESVVRNGKLIDIRGDIAGQLGGGSGGGASGKAPQFSVIDTEVVQGLKRNAAELASGATARPQTPADIATLQVRCNSDVHLRISLRRRRHISSSFLSVFVV